MSAPQTSRAVYGFSLAYRLLIYISVLVYLALAVGTLYVGLLDRTTLNPNASGVMALAAIFILCGIYSAYTALRLGETVTLSKTHITQKRANGTLLTLRWDEIVALRHRRFLGRVELVAREPSKILRLEYQLDNFADLLAEVETRLAIGEHQFSSTNERIT